MVIERDYERAFKQIMEMSRILMLWLMHVSVEIRPSCQQQRFIDLSFVLMDSLTAQH
jgi:hypothetical protein